MQHIELSADEVETLRELIERRLTEMEVEIERTDTHDFKENAGCCVRLWQNWPPHLCPRRSPGAWLPLLYESLVPRTGDWQVTQEVILF